MHSLLDSNGILQIQWDLSSVSMLGFVFLNKLPQVYLFLKTVFILNLSPILLNFSEIPLMYGMDLLSLSSFFFLYVGFLLVTQSTSFPG
jgi:hypothetical protein